MSLCHLSLLTFYLLSSNFWYVEGYDSPTPSPKTENVTRGTKVPPAKMETIEPEDTEEFMRSYSFNYGKNPSINDNDQPLKETPSCRIQPLGAISQNNSGGRGGSGGGSGVYRGGGYRVRGSVRYGGGSGRIGGVVGGRFVGGGGGWRFGGSGGGYGVGRRGGGYAGSGDSRNGRDGEDGRSSPRRRPVARQFTRRTSFDSSSDLFDGSLIQNIGDEIKKSLVQLEPKENRNSKIAKKPPTKHFKIPSGATIPSIESDGDIIVTF